MPGSIPESAVSCVACTNASTITAAMVFRCQFRAPSARSWSLIEAVVTRGGGGHGTRRREAGGRRLLVEGGVCGGVGGVRGDTSQVMGGEKILQWHTESPGEFGERLPSE